MATPSLTSTTPGPPTAAPGGPPAAVPGGPTPPAPRPAARTQKNYIVRHSELLDHATKKRILTLAMNILGADHKKAVYELPGEVDINLDVAASLRPELLAAIFGAVQARVEALRVPHGDPGGAPLPSASARKPGPPSRASVVCAG